MKSFKKSLLKVNWNGKKLKWYEEIVNLGCKSERAEMFGLAKCMNIKALTYFSTERIKFKIEITKILLKLDVVLANSALCSAKI